ncbi:hypothetical protein H112_05877 [Trichophyton rubrum D6]|uniref:Major facilitator superfamily (MFS) profile domain-containing protein n=3 Tax=Trichophyton TaxID=5550 RepID=A0A080WFZ4_TRIRC|nr:uncharacterized protein TERG_12017 [Trichophyton rubrum CBS 118892]EZF16043.1 hypothetical protein H100_05892 [Trichophyton rubrum MR850]EZF40174.1 hypothetical protein H102_05861 [Trichophyton rubrum CBS 100081]EZF50807.1 hypothetical protein H103_05888 [Trichophyton rubrum CBS 288.86]EZF61400.1 hypothetical protein H104_05874 [Trichophyton rubrum CBS 289.86]EZF71976.1 hypothetical protein H105_05902 [Trichophyton soudanense CBS 452.61]EZF82719.1 hypothetical protein H110_05883 [Trichophy
MALLLFSQIVSLLYTLPINGAAESKSSVAIDVASWVLNCVSRMILSGLSGIILIEIYAAGMQRIFQNTNNQVGKGFAILGIYLFVVNYCKGSNKIYHLGLLDTKGSRLDGMLNSTTWLYGAEVLPVSVRSKVMGLGSASHFIVNVGSVQLLYPANIHDSLLTLQYSY